MVGFAGGGVFHGGRGKEGQAGEVAGLAVFGGGHFGEGLAAGQAVALLRRGGAASRSGRQKNKERKGGFHVGCGGKGAWKEGNVMLSLSKHLYREE
ncbi:hypothetical protein GCM10027345_11890 [Hymenobacter daeguensis]